MARNGSIQVVMCTARLKAASRPRLGLNKPGRVRPSTRLRAARGPGLRSLKP